MADESPDNWRERILTAILWAGLVLGLVLLALALPWAIGEGRHLLVAGHLAALCVLFVGIFARRRIPYGLRALLILLAVYGVGLNVIRSTGLLSSGPVWLLVGSVFAASLINIRAGIATIAINAVVLFAVGWQIQTGVMGAGVFNRFVSDSHAWVSGASFVALNALTAVVMARLVQILEDSARKSREAMEDLHQERRRLLRAREDLQHEVDERLRAEQALKVSEAQYRSLVEDTSDGFFVAELPSGRFRFLNQRICDLVGYTMEEGLQLSIWEVVARNDHERIRQRVAQPGVRRPAWEGGPYTVLRKDGSTFSAEITASVVELADGPMAQGILRDITERERLLEMQRFEAIGTLAGGLAHNFNNLLMAIQGNVSVIQLDVPTSNPHHALLNSIDQAIESGKAITRQMLGFARGGKVAVEPTDLNQVVRHAAQMFGRTRRELVFRSRYEAQLHPVAVDRGQIEQMLVNLFVNAWQAMPGGGEIQLRTENVLLTEQQAAARGIAAGRYVKLSVGDTGEGMSEAVMQRLFEPFFTTKEVGQGTGLGLASVYGVVQSHRGMIEVQSEVGKGSTFEIYLPVADQPVTLPVARSQALQRGSETVLLVDDEELVLGAQRRVLGRLGYRVLTAKSGAEALRKLESQLDEIDLVLLDMTMPEMGGGEVFDKIKVLAPRVKVLLTSGYGTEGEVLAILERGCDGFVQKPFELRQLAAKLREVLDRA